MVKNEFEHKARANSTKIDQREDLFSLGSKSKLRKMEVAGLMAVRSHSVVTGDAKLPLNSITKGFPFEMS